jgi:hypothetical protein
MYPTLLMLLCMCVLQLQFRICIASFIFPRHTSPFELHTSTFELHLRIELKRDRMWSLIINRELEWK